MTRRVVSVNVKVRGKREDYMELASTKSCLGTLVFFMSCVCSKDEMSCFPPSCHLSDFSNSKKAYYATLQRVFPDGSLEEVHSVLYYYICMCTNESMYMYVYKWKYVYVCVRMKVCNVWSKQVRAQKSWGSGKKCAKHNFLWNKSNTVICPLLL